MSERKQEHVLLLTAFKASGRMCVCVCECILLILVCLLINYWKTSCVYEYIQHLVYLQSIQHFLGTWFTFFTPCLWFLTFCVIRHILRNWLCSVFLLWIYLRFVFYLFCEKKLKIVYKNNTQAERNSMLYVKRCANGW